MHHVHTKKLKEGIKSLGTRVTGCVSLDVGTKKQTQEYSMLLTVESFLLNPEYAF